ncbi:MAG: hypothetical protein M0006_08910 [Magnetospirillum sp.]|nr:hypothetical protein [Magnetospirillum sp.]
MFIPGHQPPAGVLPAQDFTIGTHATTPSQMPIFNPNDHTLYLDPDGSGSQYQPIPLFHLPNATVTASDIVAM